MNTLSDKKKAFLESSNLIGKHIYDTTNFSSGKIINQEGKLYEAEFESSGKKWSVKIDESKFEKIGETLICYNEAVLLTEEEQKQVNELSEKIYDAMMQREVTLQHIDEGFFSSLIGGIAGFIAGPAIGRAIAKALGVEKGILYDLMTSRLAGAALGKAVASYLSDQGVEVAVKD